MTRHGIVVGYDGSPDAEHALTWAVREARARASVLTVCLAQDPGYPAATTEGTDAGADAKRGEKTLAAGVRLARELTGDAEVRPLLVAGPPAATLCGLCPDAEMVVVGSRGRGGMAGLPVGSVSLEVAAHARGRVVVVRGAWQPVPGVPLPVAVGSDGSPGSEAAVRFALEEAALHDTYLLAVCALADAPGVLGTAGQIREDFEQLMARQEGCHREVAVRRQVSEGSARAALLDAAGAAQMLVVGARGRGGLQGVPIGSAGLAMIGYAACPVGIVHS
jgi:nucleotide-binding universal stress UspA family protein